MMHRNRSLVSYPVSDDDEDQDMPSSYGRSGSGSHGVPSIVVRDRRGRGRGAVTMAQNDNNCSGSCPRSRSVGCLQQVADSTSPETMQISRMKRSAMTQDRCQSRTIDDVSNTCTTNTERQVAFVPSHECRPGSYCNDSDETTVKQDSDSCKPARKSYPEKLFYKPPAMRTNSLQRTESWDDDLFNVPVMVEPTEIKQLSKRVIETDTNSVRIVELRMENDVSESRNTSNEILDSNVKQCERILPEVVKITPVKSTAKLYIPPPMRSQSSNSTISVPLSEIPLPPDKKNTRVGIVGIAHVLKTQKDRVEKRTRHSAEFVPVSNVKMIVSENDNDDSVFHDDVKKMPAKSLARDTTQSIQGHRLRLPPPDIQKPPMLIAPIISIPMTVSPCIPSDVGNTYQIQSQMWQLPQYSCVQPSSSSTGFTRFGSAQYPQFRTGSDSTVQETEVSSTSPWQTPDKRDFMTPVSSTSPALSLSACKISTPSEISSKSFQRYQSNSMPILATYKTRAFNSSLIHAKRLFSSSNTAQTFPNRTESLATNYQSVASNVGDNNTTSRNHIFTSKSLRYGNWKEYISRCQGGSSLPFIDSHCHLDFLFKRIHFQGTFADYKRQNAETFLDSFEGCVSVFCDPATFTPKGGLWKLLAHEDDIWLAMGCHPKYAEQYDGLIEENLKECLKHPKMVAAGEFGLDYSGTFHMSSVVQKIVFTRQLELSVEMGKPLVIHVRDADDDAFNLMKQYVPKHTKIHRHCFTGPFHEANRWLQEFPNLFIGITPVVTYRSAVGAHDLAQKIPLDRLLLETDAPYFVPQKVNRDEMPYTHPGLAITVAAEVAQYKGITVSEVLKACRRNTHSMYGI